MTWWALAMTFGSIPGICFFAYGFQCGFEDRKIALSGFLTMLRGVYRAKNNAIKQTGRMLAGKNAVVFSFLIGLLLLCIATDTIMLAAVNTSAVPAGILCCRQGRRHRRASGLSLEEIRRRTAKGEAIDIVVPWKRVALPLLVWLGLAGAALTVAYFFGIWRPQ